MAKLDKQDMFWIAAIICSGLLIDKGGMPITGLFLLATVIAVQLIRYLDRGISND